MKHKLKRLFKLRKALVVCSMLVSAGIKAARVMAYMFDICRCGGLSKTAWGGKHIAHNVSPLCAVRLLQDELTNEILQENKKF